MPRVTRVSDILEEYGEKAVMTGLSGIVALGIATVLFIFRGQGSLLGLATVLAVGGGAGVIYAVYCVFKARKVTGLRYQCVYCKAMQDLAATPEDDFRCTECHRMIPVRDGQVLPVEQVRCGYCNSLNYYSAKTEVLLCENCNHEIPITTESGTITKRIMPGFAVTDDENLYELVLQGVEHQTEEVIGALQQMLALNRNQVKAILDDLPAVLLRGIPRKKAEMLKAQLSVHGAVASFEPIGEEVG